jgi:hypothetical protein
VIVAPAVSVVKPTEHSQGRLELLRRLFRDGHASARSRA